MAKQWSVIGGGILGLTLALRLAQRGYKVTVFEYEQNLGGLANSWELNGIVCDRHYHVILLSDMFWRRVLSEIGLENKIIWTKTKTGFCCEGKLYPLSNAIDYLRLPVIGLTAKMRLAANIIYASKIKNWKKLEKISAIAWLCQISGEQVLEKIWIPLLKAKLGQGYENASAAFIWAIIARLYAARQSGIKTEMFGYIPGGYAEILTHFRIALEKLGVQIKTEYCLQKIIPSPTGLLLKFDNGYFESSNKAALTITPPQVVPLVPDLSLDEKTILNGIEYQGIICAAVLVRRPLSNYYLTYLTDADLPFTAVVEMSALVDSQYFKGNSLIYLPKYLNPKDPLFSATDTEIRREFLLGLTRIYPHINEDDIIGFRISRVKYVFPISTREYSERVPKITTTIPGLYLVNSSQILNGTLNVNETVKLANQAIEILL